VRSYDLDWRGHTSLRALNGFLQETARGYATRARLGVDTLDAASLGWALHRLRIELASEARVGESVAVLGWPSERRGLSHHLDFEVTGEDGRSLARASTAWVIFDALERRAVRRPDTAAMPPLVDRPRALVLGRDKPPRVTSPESARSFRVRLGDIDANGHVANGRYLEWMLESTPSTVWSTHRLAAVEVLFRDEALYDEEILTESEAPGESMGSGTREFAHHAIRKRDGLRFAAATSVWSPP